AFGPVHHAGHAYFFCAASCRDKFRTNPDRYLKRGAEPMEAAAPEPGVSYTCPMHPEVVSDTPGAGPICGRALEPAAPPLEDSPVTELSALERKLVVGIILGVPVILVAMVSMWPNGWLSNVLPMRISIWLQAVLSTPVVLWCGWIFFRRAWDSVLALRPNM